MDAPGFPRLWVGPRGEVVDLADGHAHSAAVRENPALYGLEQAEIDHMSDWWESQDLDPDYVLLIVRAEMNGWARVSRDCARDGDTVSITAADAPSAGRALRALNALGHWPKRVELEIETLEGSQVMGRFGTAVGQHLVPLRRGRLSMEMAGPRPWPLDVPPADWTAEAAIAPVA